jgi:hypothetical protein
VAATHLDCSATLTRALMRHSHLMVNDQLRQLCLPMSRIGTERQAARSCGTPPLPGTGSFQDLAEAIPRSFNFYENMRRICFEVRTRPSKLPGMVTS